MEGIDDKFSIIHLMKKHGFDFDSPPPDAFHVEDHGGESGLLRPGVIEAAVKSYRRVGIVLDADRPEDKRWATVGDRLREAGLSLPEFPVTGGYVGNGINPDWKVGVWLMPDNGSNGALEEFLTPLIPSDDTLWSQAQQSTDKAVAIDQRFREQHRLKAQLRCWLAWQEQPGQPYGTALAANYFGFELEGAKAFVAWFRNLFQ